MALPGLLIEYLVSGALAFAWLLPLLQHRLSVVEAPYLPVFLLLLYVLGMAIDFLAWWATRLPKHWIRAWVYRKYRGPGAIDNESGTLRAAKIGFYAPELAKELAMRSSRDRIARGAIINALLAAIFHLPWWAGVSAVAFTVTLWASFERLSYGYELCAEQIVDEQHQREQAKRVA
ncbi:hypothetical protein [Chitinivorax sp. B]|uniref:hypothetical protein n=1 Tax=Chitinivorax sp. B TaxID=2502235 RepID=UPI0010F795B6|nr:hypothetical protein [Chitinivorax sp. B]